jgi:hypothetical protein
MSKIEILKSWHVGKDLIHTGVYRIPQDMSADLAARATKAGVGQILPEDKPKPAPRFARKTPAPENKVLSPAPEVKEPQPFPAEDD